MGWRGRLIHNVANAEFGMVAVNADYIMIEYQDFSSDGNNARVFRCFQTFIRPPDGLPLDMNWFPLQHWISLANFRGGIAIRPGFACFRRNSTTRNAYLLNAHSNGNRHGIEWRAVG